MIKFYKKCFETRKIYIHLQSVRNSGLFLLPKKEKKADVAQLARAADL